MGVSQNKTAGGMVYRCMFRGRVFQIKTDCHGKDICCHGNSIYVAKCGNL